MTHPPEPTFGAALIVGAVLAFVIHIVVIATGQTFGQRCTAAGYIGEDWSRCVHSLSKGAGMPPSPAAQENGR